ncbi:hypothetical protein H0H93_001750 [Arthromyces matolae]|nr:hypothetical protein H0H93_001750 [Arthromyces matolae]
MSTFNVTEWEAIRGAFDLFDDYDHDSFEVIKKETQFGGYEVLQRKVFPMHGDPHRRFYRKAVIPSSNKSFEEISQSFIEHLTQARMEFPYGLRT